MTDLLLLSCVTLTLGATLSALLVRRLIPWLSGKAKQPIYEVGPAWHISKSGTPTMGGIAFPLAIGLPMMITVIISMLKDDNTAVGTELIISFLFMTFNALVGLFDDLVKLRRRENAGLSPLQKILLQLLITLLFLMARGHFMNDNSIIDLGVMSFDAGIWYYPLMTFLSLGIINCANLTDGIDGLASTTAICISFCYLILGLCLSITTLSVTAAAVFGCAIGFLIFNRHPARIFMGDTGSLMLGAAAFCMTMTLGNPAIVIASGIVYVIEGVSVIIQVAVYKLTKKRLFKMAPLHHHLEKCGLSENRICIIAATVSLLGAIIGFLVARV